MYIWQHVGIFDTFANKQIADDVSLRLELYI